MSTLHTLDTVKDRANGKAHTLDSFNSKPFDLENTTQLSDGSTDFQVISIFNNRLSMRITRTFLTLKTSMILKKFATLKPK